MCVFRVAYPSLSWAHTIILFPSLQAGEILVIYTAQVRPDSNMSDICYYSRISFCPSTMSGICPCKVGRERFTRLIDTRLSGPDSPPVEKVNFYGVTSKQMSSKAPDSFDKRKNNSPPSLPFFSSFSPTGVGNDIFS